MCQLFGFTAKDNVCLNKYLKAFFKNSSEHPHGWGISFVQDDELISEKEPLQASKSNYLKERLSYPISTNLAMAHIRYATIGNVSRVNCHPYKKRDNFNRKWILIHNGTIFDYPPLQKFINVQKGETDSERILLYIVEKINILQEEKGRSLNFTERFSLLDEIVCDMSKGNKLNLIICDGKYMYVHTNYKDSLHCKKSDGAIMFSTEPLDKENDNSWKKVPFTTLMAYKAGRLIREGTTHNNEYKEDEKSTRYLYQIFSEL